MRRADGAVDRRQRDVRRRAGRSRRCPGPRLRHAQPDRPRPRVVRDRRADGAPRRVRAGGRGPRNDRARRRPAAPGRGRRPEVASLGCRARRARPARRVRPHRTAGAVRLPGRQPGRLGAHARRLALAARPRSVDSGFACVVSNAYITPLETTQAHPFRFPAPVTPSRGMERSFVTTVTGIAARQHGAIGVKQLRGLASTRGRSGTR